MRPTRHAVRALALSLSLTAVGAFGVAGAASSAQAWSSAAGRAASSHRPAGHGPASDPVGGAQLSASGVIVNLGPGVPAPPKMPGQSFVMADLDTGEILVAKAPHAPHLPASTLKTLTALTLIPRLDAKAKVVATAADARADGTHVGIVAGSAYTVQSLFQGLLLSSGNDAAYALARANHSVAVTLGQMNATASDLGALDTVARDPSGLDATGQTTSAYDLALIGRAAMKLPDFRDYVATKSATFPGARSGTSKPSPSFQITNHNHFLFNYDGAIGVKNGYTIAAKQTIISAATRGGKSYIFTEMASDNGSWRPTAALLDWAFANGSRVAPIGKLVEPRSVSGSQAASSSSGTPHTSTTPGAGAGATDGPGRPDATALGRTKHSGRLPELLPWLVVVTLISALALVGTLATRGISRRRR